MISRKRHPIICLLEILVEFFGYAVLLGLGAQLDQLLFSTADQETVGHPIPVFFAIVMVIATILLVVTVSISLFHFLLYSIQKWKAKHGQGKTVKGQAEEGQMENKRPEK